MKKLLTDIFALVLALLMLVPLSLPVFADAGGPVIVPYEVVVNPGGTVTQEGDIIPEGTVLTILFEYEKDGVMWGFTEYGDNHQQGYINLADVSNGDTIPEEAGRINSLSDLKHFIVVAEDGVNVYAGPGYAYNVLFTVPRGERLSGRYYMGSWEYLRYGGSGGWVLTEIIDFQPEVVMYSETAEPITVWTMAETEISDIPWFNGGNIVGTVPANMKFESNQHSFPYCYVTYEGQSGWIKYSDSPTAVGEGNHIYKATDDGTLCLYDFPSDYDNGNSEPARTLETKNGEYFLCRFMWRANGLLWSYIEDEGISGWTPVFDENSDCDIANHPYASDILEYTKMAMRDYNAMIAKQEYESHLADVQDDCADETEMPAKDILPPESDTSDDKVPDDKTPDDKTPDDKTPDDKTPDDKTPDDKTPDVEAPTESFFASPTAIITFCVISAVVLALVAAVVLTIIKKKKAK